MAAEAASLRISMEAISLGFKSLMVDVFIPSTMYKGSLLPLEPVPRTRILTPAPGEPDTGNTDIPAVFPCMACSTRPTAPRSRSSGLTDEMAAVTTLLRCTPRSEEHTSELQSRPHLVCRLLLEKK